MSDLHVRLQAAGQSGHLLASSVKNILNMLARSESPVVSQSVAELVGCEEWGELNDRFYKTIAFGTGRAAGAHHREDRYRGGTW